MSLPCLKSQILTLALKALGELTPPVSDYISPSLTKPQTHWLHLVFKPVESFSYPRLFSWTLPSDPHPHSSHSARPGLHAWASSFPWALCLKQTPPFCGHTHLLLSQHYDSAHHFVYLLWILCVFHMRLQSLQWHCVSLPSWHRNWCRRGTQ